MSSTIKNREKILIRIRRIKGQLGAVERALSTKQNSAPILHILSAVRGALNGLMSELISDHIQTRIIDSPAKARRSIKREAQDLIEICKTYLT